VRSPNCLEGSVVLDNWDFALYNSFVAERYSRLREAPPQFIQLTTEIYAMAPLPPNSTPRFKCFYTNVSTQHTIQVRSHDSPLAVGLNIDDLFNALSPLLFSTVIDEVQFAAAGSNVFNAVTTGIEGTTYGSGGGIITNVPVYIDFVGRSTDGRRVREAVFGIKDIGVDYRYVAGENSAVDAAIAALNAPANHWVSIGDLPVIWKSYANAGYNAYWQRNSRP